MDRRGFLAGLLASGAVHPVWAEGAVGLAPASSPFPRRRGDGGAVSVRPASAEALIRAAELGGVTGFAVADAATGVVLEAGSADVALPPASVAKAVTAMYVLDRLGTGHRYATRLVATGPVEGGRINGDLILVGSGDPVLNTDHLAAMAATLAERGVKGISGRYLVHASALPNLPLIDADQPEFVGYNPALSGLNLNFNRVHFEWRRGQQGYAVSMDARSETLVPPVRMATMRIVPREAPLFTYEAGAREDRWTVASGALGKGGARWMPVRHPQVYAAEVFQTLAKSHGIDLPAASDVDELPAGSTLVEHLSEPMAPILRDMLKFSTNLTAEVVGLTASGKATLPASAELMTAWASERHGLAARFVDHSGLGGASRITAGDMVRALVASHATPLPGLLRDVGMRDEKGKAIKEHPVRVLAKTGTLNFVSGLGGYIMPPSGRILAFGIFSADVPRREALQLAERESPPGGEGWTRRARILQGRLVDRWARLYA
ncbi:D-alanyl-D-alanine carboxypeptidase/D-alanyl-D-alanine-endopeptidase [Aliigemmobacter aestuarii]|uniref:D-alanyl-D-alanine carboxypeptidase/D-alanyl-D-alanine-endopeptidase n=1 Tax=Aliigemmobacter aestuarii TaxID=1445661 RepID=A0A4V3V0S2_9RHOB|nr:D-alanyl-D-alanine carboxypeptidase/D-alanyl-D-alanine-endopeptidase [Gemmobacter aestuarii]THD85062.1 D-alanyl-D-alanine carboxypeptidase/D-alanyl-D-alanine-endopeptidase [Gemmobacter aestuarii]